MVLFVSYLFALLLAFSPATQEQKQFFKSLRAQAGQSYSGTATVYPPGNTSIAGKELKLFIEKASGDSIRVPFWVGDNKSRTLLLTLHKKQGLSLKHDHRHADGSPETMTMYGGYADTSGNARGQNFPADARTAQLSPRNATSVWAIALSPDKKHLTYTLKTNNKLVYQLEFKQD